ncbi:hypothetical protein AAC387_Pa06g1918 [Persea americana]
MTITFHKDDDIISIKKVAGGRRDRGEWGENPLGLEVSEMEAEDFFCDDEQLGIELLEELENQGRVVMDGSAFEEGCLMGENQLRKD